MFDLRKFRTAYLLIGVDSKTPLASIQEIKTQIKIPGVMVYVIPGLVGAYCIKAN